MTKKTNLAQHKTQKINVAFFLSASSRKMFSNQQSAMDFVAQQRAAVVAAKQKKQIKQSPKQVPGSRSSFDGGVPDSIDSSSTSFSSVSEATWKERRQEAIDVAMAKVDVSIDAQKAEQAVVLSKIDRHSRMGLARLGHSQNRKGK
jgi:hypothetical protein